MKCTLAVAALPGSWMTGAYKVTWHPAEGGYRTGGTFWSKIE